MADNQNQNPDEDSSKPAPKDPPTRAVLTEHARNSRLGRELVAHCFFLMIFCIVTVLPVDDANYEGMTWSLRNMLLQQDNALFNSNASFSGTRYVDITTTTDFWKWLRGPFLHAIYMTNWYAGDPWSVGDQQLLMGHNLIVGTVSVRQKRVKSASCSIPVAFIEEARLADCIADFSPSVEDKEAFGPFYTEPEWASAFTFTPEWPSFHGGLKAYSSGAFSLELPASACETGGVAIPCISKADAMLQDLQSTGWLDYRTRAVLVELTVFNPPLNRFTLVQAIVELPATGGMVPHANIRTAKLIRYATTTDYAMLGLEISLLLLIAFDVMDKVVFYRAYELRLREQYWDMYDVCMELLFLILVAFRINAAVVFGSLNLDPTVRVYYNFAHAVYWYDVAEGLAAWLAVMVWARTLKFLHELSWARLILQALLRAVLPLLGLCLTLLVSLLAFAHCGLLAFGSQIHDLRSFSIALSSCFRFIFTGMRYEEFRVAGGFLGPLYYIAFKVWMVLIVVRFFVAVILDSYRQVMEENRHSFALSFPPLSALAHDIATWWEESRGRRAPPPKERPFGGALAQPGVPNTLSGLSLHQASLAAKEEEGELSELDARQMYLVLQDRVSAFQEHLDGRVSNIEKMFVTTVAPLVETLDILVRQQTDNAALASVQAIQK